MRNKHNVALFGILLALALVLSYLESLIPLSFGIPGIKLGLPNLVVIFALYRYHARGAAVLSLIRVLLVSVLFGSVLSLIYSAAGAVLSFGAMVLLKRSNRFSMTGVSVAGAVAHNVGQLLAAAVMLGTSRLAWYFPVLCISGTAAGVCIGLLAAVLVKRVRGFS